MKINTNIASMSAIRSLDTTSKALSRALERLASGKRINRAGDDASGLAISNGLESQIRGMNQTVRNINDAAASLNTLDGVMAEQMNILQRMRELAMQSANGTLSSADRTNLNIEFTKLYAEFNRLGDSATKADFGIKAGDTTSIQVGASKSQSISITTSVNDLDKFSKQYAATVDKVSTTTATRGFSMTMMASGFSSLSNGVGIGDVNLDGKADLFIGGRSGAAGGLFTYFGNGTGGFSGNSYLDLGFSPANDYAFGDFNEDGRIDVADYTGNLAIYTGRSNGSFALFSTATAPGQNRRAITADVNHDGHLDIVGAHLSATNTYSVNLGNGDGTFKNSINLTGQSNAWDMSLADFNGDGNLDLAKVDSTGSTQVWFGVGDGSFSGVTALAGQGSGITTGDFNGDSKADVIAATSASGLVLYAGNGNGTFATGVVLDAVPTYGIRTDDLDKDGKLDFVATVGDTVSIFYGNGNGTFKKVSVSQGSSSDTRFSTIGDLNGDGFKDIVATHNADGNVAILFAQTQSSESSTFALPPSITTQSLAQDALGFIDYSLTQMKTNRASLGAYLNRLEYAANNNMKTAENLSQAKSTILDSDVAVETADLTRQQILQQAGVGVLGQANTSLQIALALLRNI